MVRAALSSTGPRREGQDASAASPARSFSLSLQSAASEMHHPPLSSSSSAALMSSPSAVNFSTMLGPVVEEARRCRYKTGKCSNARSSKRNGQPHQLCLYHRDKANQIQRKFDRQKRQVLRERKGSSSSPSSSACHSHSPTSPSTSASGPHASLSGLHRSHLQLHYSQQQRHSHLHQFQHKSPLNTTSASSVRNVTNFVPRFTSLAAKDLDIYSDSDASSRFSTDSSSSDVSSSMWADLPSPVSATAFMGLLRLTPVAAPTASTPTDPRVMITPTATSATAQGHLSHDEIDFLCSAMLE